MGWKDFSEGQSLPMADAPMKRLVVERYFDAECGAVFDAWTDPELIARWFFVGDGWSAQARNDLTVGGSYELRMNTDDGQTHVMRGEYLEIERPRRLAFTWSSHVATGTTVIIELEPRGSGTQLTLTHLLPDIEDVRKAHEAGWRGCLENLARLSS